MDKPAYVSDPVDVNTCEAQPAEPQLPATSRFLPMAMASALFMDLLDTSALGAALPTLAMSQCRRTKRPKTYRWVRHFRKPRWRGWRTHG